MGAPKFVFDSNLEQKYIQTLLKLLESLTRVALNQEMKKEIEENQKHLSETFGIHPGDASLYINGLHIDLDVHNSFSILETIKTEGKTLNGLSALGINNQDLSKYLRIQVHSSDENYALDIRHSSITWINDIETDHMYSPWPSSVQELLRPAFPGVIRPIRRNFFNLVLFVDPVQENAADYVKLTELFYRHNVPLRIGFVFVINSDEESNTGEDAGAAFLQAFNYIAEESDSAQAFSSIINMYNKLDYGETLTVDIIKAVMKSDLRKVGVDKVMGLIFENNNKIKAGATFYKKSGLGPLPQVLFNGVPFNSEEMDIEEMETVILQKILDAIGFFQRAVFMGLLSDQLDAVDFLMDQPNVVSRLNPSILASEKNYINFISISDEDVIHAVTIWIIADFDKPAGRQLLATALKHMKKTSITRLGILNNPTVKMTVENTLISRALWAGLLTQKSQNLPKFFKRLSREETAAALFNGRKIKEFLVPEIDEIDAFDKKYNTMGLDLLRTQELYCREVLKLLPGQMATVSNGRIR